MARSDRESSKERFWRAILRLWKASAQTVRDFCIEHEVSEPSFYSWRRVIAQRDQQAKSARHRNSSAGDLPAFVPLTVAPALPGPTLEVVAAGRVIRVPLDFDPATLRRLLSVLEEASPC